MLWVHFVFRSSFKFFVRLIFRFDNFLKVVKSWIRTSYRIIVIKVFIGVAVGSFKKM
jgi:hypothetical protein